MFRIGKSLVTLSLLGVITIALAPTAGKASTAGDISYLNVLNTSPLWADSASYHACNVVNVSTSTVSVSIELIEAGGGVINSVTNAAIAAGTSYELLEASGNGFARCRFTLQDNPAVIRANLTIFRPVSGTFQTYATSEAR